MLCSRVKQPTEKYFSKLVQMMKYICSTRSDMLKVSDGNRIKTLEWFADASFAVHPGFKSHTRATMKFQERIRSSIQMRLKQKLNTYSSTMAELEVVHQVLPKALWVPLFLESQCYSVEKNIV